jgi:hypothetical protein
MRIKIRATIFTLLFCVGLTLAGKSQAPEKPIRNIDQALAAIPLPKLSAAEALDTAKKYAKGRARPDNYTIVAIDWCKSSDFKPAFSDGYQWSVIDDQSAYAWFVTFIVLTQEYSGTRFVGVIRVKENGKVDGMVGTRT